MAGLPATVIKQLHATREINDLERMIDWVKLLLILNHKKWAATVGSPTPNQMSPSFGSRLPPSQSRLQLSTQAGLPPIPLTAVVFIVTSLIMFSGTALCSEGFVLVVNR